MMVTTINHIIQRQIVPSTFRRLPFLASLDSISILMDPKIQGVILKIGGVVLRRNFGWENMMITTINHINQRQIVPSTFWRLPFWSSLDSISILMDPKIHGEIIMLSTIHQQIILKLYNL